MGERSTLLETDKERHGAGKSPTSRFTGKGAMGVCNGGLGWTGRLLASLSSAFRATVSPTLCVCVHRPSGYSYGSHLSAPLPITSSLLAAPFQGVQPIHPVAPRRHELLLLQLAKLPRARQWTRCNGFSLQARGGFALLFLPLFLSKERKGGGGERLLEPGLVLFGGSPRLKRPSWLRERRHYLSVSARVLLLPPGLFGFPVADWGTFPIGRALARARAQGYPREPAPFSYYKIIPFCPLFCVAPQFGTALLPLQVKVANTASKQQPPEFAYSARSSQTASNFLKG